MKNNINISTIQTVESVGLSNQAVELQASNSTSFESVEIRVCLLLVLTS